MLGSWQWMTLAWLTVARLRIADCALGRIKRTVSLPPTEKPRQLTIALGVICWMLSVEPAWSKLTCPSVPYPHLTLPTTLRVCS